jgi:hypothetical protein
LNLQAKEIEEARIQIAQAYGELNEQGTAYSIPNDK